MIDDPLCCVDEGQIALCPELYRKLKYCFGEVQIANQGEPFQQVTRRDRLGVLQTTVVSGGEYYRVSCPFCDDTRKRLWINHMFGKPDGRGRPMWFLAICYNEECTSEFENCKKLADIVFGFTNSKERRPSRFAVQDAPWDGAPAHEIKPPGEVIPMVELVRTNPTHPAVTYMVQSRRYTTHVLDKYQVSFCTRAASEFRQAQGKVIFPIYMDSRLVGWQARYVGDNVPKSEPKYYGCPGMAKRKILYNYDNAKGKPFVVVSEGVTDVHVVGDTGVALLGKTLSGPQLQMLTNTWPSGVVVLTLDPDAEANSSKMEVDLTNNGNIVVPVRFPDDRDCADYDTVTVWNIITAAANARGVRLPSVI